MLGHGTSRLDTSSYFADTLRMKTKNTAAAVHEFKKVVGMILLKFILNSQAPNHATAPKRKTFEYGALQK